MKIELQNLIKGEGKSFILFPMLAIQTKGDDWEFGIGLFTWLLIIKNK
jgi:hypothetical protein